MTEIIPVDKILQTNEASTDDDGHLATSLAVGEQADNELKQEEMAKFHWARCKSKWFVVDGLGITCAGITYGLIIFAEFVVVGVILLPEFPRSPWGYVHTVIFTCLAILAAAAHVRSMTTDPGAIPKGNFNEHNIKCLGYKPGDVVVRCTKCECIKLNRAHHCSTCQRCVRKMDHHCPWINNCVGEFNQKFFMLFTFYIMTISIYALGLSIRYIYSCSGNDWQDCAYFSPPATIIFIVFLVFEGLLFGIFTLVMFCTQFNAVVKDETGIEHLKKEKQEDDGTWE